MRFHTTGMDVLQLIRRMLYCYLTPEFCWRKGELEGGVEVVLLLMAPVDHLPLPHHQESGVAWVAHHITHLFNQTARKAHLCCGFGIFSLDLNPQIKNDAVSNKNPIVILIKRYQCQDHLNIFHIS